MLSIEYCARAIIRHLNKDFEMFEDYRDKAIDEYEKENKLVTIEELIPKKTKNKLYEMVG